MIKPDQSLTIRVFPSAEGGLIFDIWKGDVIDEDAIDPDDGGICTSGCHAADCDDDNCEGCPEEMDKPYTIEDYKNALEMATSQALDLLKMQN